ncbi:hypothetical protein AVEN_119195-1 [Araneus ventricosus]|uniref:PiggyBac transposable element-derived protein domain-containing protein n=1 Tax=Araneus ventricosus TaxID=182803 RepID=A0A4Y2K5E0_ARAVE|nr:hypothetical protein AVEN_119195-1 [Araneus ventricosus]
MIKPLRLVFRMVLFLDLTAEDWDQSITDKIITIDCTPDVANFLYKRKCKRKSKKRIDDLFWNEYILAKKPQGNQRYLSKETSLSVLMRIEGA